MGKENLPKIVPSGGGLPENNEENRLSQEFTSVGLEPKQNKEVNFDTLLWINIQI